ncbi:MAG: glycoside hydrolase family 9 protein [Ruminococcus sp.]|nr:glycoside hydrolase family 9 protein [Ruminococcus sp.]
MKRILAAMTAIVLTAGMLSACGTQSAGTSSSQMTKNSTEKGSEIVMEDNYNVLQTITILGMDRPDGENIGETHESEDISPFRYITLTSANSMINLRGWAATDLSAYVPNGIVRFEVKGDPDSIFDIGFEEFTNGMSVISKISSDGIISVTGEWTSVEIPVKAIMEESGNSLLHARKFLIGSAQGEVSVRNITLESPDKEQSFPEIKVNQIGYKTDGSKRALVTGFPDELKANEGDAFEVVDKNSGETVYEGKLDLVEEYDMIYSGEKMLSADFSEFNSEGRYFIRLKDNVDIEASPSFDISDNVYEELLKNTMRYFYYQRANCDITEEFGGEFTRGDETPKDFDAPLSSDRNVSIDVSGGWYDAGDVGKYVAPGATAVNTLMWAYKMFPDRFSDGQNNIPESGNGIPDILDEIKYELDFILKMQDKDSGGFYLKVKSQSERDEDGDRTVWQGDGDKCLTNATADCTAVLAFGSTIFRDFDKTYADTLISAAKKGWDYIDKNPDVYTVTNYSGSDNNSSLFWACACMYYATGESRYNDYFKEHAEENHGYMKNGSYCHSVSSMAIYGYFTYMLCDNKDDALAAEIAEKYDSWKTGILKKYDDNPWNISIDSNSFWWGSFNIILGNAQDMYIGDKVFGLSTDDSEKISRDASDFILGVNAMRKCYITGMGEDSISCTFSNFWGKLPKGYMPGGINNQNGNIISRFPIKSYADEPADWFTNENAIYWNAVMVFNTAMNG